MSILSMFRYISVTGIVSAWERVIFQSVWLVTIVLTITVPDNYVCLMEALIHEGVGTSAEGASLLVGIY